MRAHFTSVLANLWTKKTQKIRPGQIWETPFERQRRKSEAKKKEEIEELIDEIGPDAIPVEPHRNKDGS